MTQEGVRKQLACADLKQSSDGSEVGYELTDECLTCGGYEDLLDAKCSRSQRACGHHCNHTWTHDSCHWCGNVWGEEVEPMKPEQIARVVHEANRAVQIEQNDPTIPVSLSWDETDAETQRSAVEGVVGVQSGNTPEQSHEGWMQFKHANGWTLGPIKDEAKKEHPLLVPYDELPSSQRVKDALFVNIVRALTAPNSV